MEDDAAQDFPPCDRCEADPADPAALDGLVPELPGARDIAPPRALARALARCARCLSLPGSSIDRSHVDEVMRAAGGGGWLLRGRHAAAAREARPDLPPQAQIVAEEGAALWDPRTTLTERIASLERVSAPPGVVAPLREALAALQGAPDFEPEWHRVHAWPPPPGACDGLVAHTEIAKVLARIALPRLDASDALDAVERAAAQASLDERAWADRERLVRRGDAGARLAVRFLDELGHTDLNDNQDTLLDDTYFTLAAAGVAREADVYRAWLEQAFPAAWKELRRRAAESEAHS